MVPRTLIISSSVGVWNIHSTRGCVAHLHHLRELRRRDGVDGARPLAEEGSA